MKKVELLKGCSEEDLIRMWDLAQRSLGAIEKEIYERGIGTITVKHGSKSLSMKYLIKSKQIEIDFK